MKTLTTVLVAAVVVFSMGAISQAGDESTAVNVHAGLERNGWVVPPIDKLPEPASFKPE